MDNQTNPFGSLEEKPFYQSTTFWINAAGVAAILLDFAITENMIPDARYVTVALGLLNILNRFQLTEPVKKLTLK